MVPLPNLLTFALASVALIALPGPTVLFVIGRSLALGRLGGFLSVVGNALGMLPVIAAVALGLGAIVTESVLVFTVVKFAGAAYIVYLGVQAIRHRRTAAGSIAVSTAAKSKWRLLAEGSVVGISNPKSIVFFVAVLPQFVDYSAGAVPMQLMSLGIVFVVLALLGDSTWALAAGSARDWFAKSPRRMEHLSATGGVMMVGLGGVLAATGASS
ncbi:LysE family translocator [Cryobacterium sp. TMT1-21]|uniref:LysE family translocator n=1 Tax=Cryobacterium shii TaxID=1259235 RepID=A0AAQ2C6N0_9MICO|nr:MULTISPECIES: LysE family translocator [Cryobacterium]TFC47579.1 LysE family translocator [Cryobacterium shii]TFC85045.1 LysE family translocator [Cryobacterium sp. TmT2-59]TFD13912.1 LysE family translocator [Cryobacterium sp. TMT1-21]TFD20073.1 LysE family translocator [Cryobacterium sp. TMT4-10]TFD21928.1 LysE family translocator [Cryobacterium sp. TMT2-23]